MLRLPLMLKKLGCKRDPWSVQGIAFAPPIDQVPHNRTEHNFTEHFSR